MKSILEKLKGGDLRSIGKANKLTKFVLANPKFFQELFNGMTDIDPLIRMRAADVAEKVSQERPEYLQPFKPQLINEIAKIAQPEVRWHVAQMFSYLTLTPKEKGRIAKTLFYWLKTEPSNIVRVMSLQTLADFAKQNNKIKNKILPLLRKYIKCGSPSLMSRSRKLLKELTVNVKY